MLRQLVLSAMIVVAVHCGTPSVSAQRWEGSGSNDNWSTDSNWTNKTIPANDGTADVFFNGTRRLTPFVDVPWSTRSITFESTAGKFTIGGNALTIGAGGISNASVELQTFDNAISLSGPQTWAASRAPLLFNGDVTLGTQALSFSARAGTSRIIGAVGGSGGLTKTATGTLLLGGTTDNFALGITASAGTLILAKTSSASVHAIGGGGLSIDGGTVQLGGSGGDQLYDFADVTITSGTFDTNGQNESFGAFTLSGTGVGGAGALVNSAAAASTLAPSSMSLAAAATIGVTHSGGSLTLNNAIGGNFPLTKVGAGTLRLGGGSANTFAGLGVMGGTVVLEKSGLGGQAFNGPLVIKPGATVRTTNPEQIKSASDLTIEGGTLDIDASERRQAGNYLLGGTITGTGMLQLEAGDITAWASPGGNTISTSNMLLNATHQFDVEDGPAAVDLNVSSSIRGPGTIMKVGAGSLRLAPPTPTSNDFSGGLVIQAGTVVFGADGAGGSQLISISGGTISSDTPVTLLNNIFINSDFAASGDLALNGQFIDLAVNSTMTVSGNLRLGGNIMGPQFGITKNGPGTLTLAGPMAFPGFTYAGPVIVNEGTLVLAKEGGLLFNDFGASIQGPLIINPGGTVRLGDIDQITDRHLITINGGTLDVNGHLEGTRTGFDMTGGRIIGLGVINLAANITTRASANSSIISAEYMDLFAENRTFEVADGSAALDLDVSSLLSAGGLTKTGPGTLRLGGPAANTYGDATVVEAGTLILDKPSSITAIMGNLTVGSSQPAVVRLWSAEQINNASTLTLNPTGSFDLNGFDETVANFLMSGDVTGVGTLTTEDNFTYHAGAFAGRLRSRGTASFNKDFRAGNGMENSGSTSPGNVLLTFDGAGLDNQGSIAMTGGTIGGSGPIINNGLMNGFGTIAGSGGFINNTHLAQGAGNFVLANTGVNSNVGNIDLTAGRQLVLQSGAALDNVGTINLNSASITGGGTLANMAGGTIGGRGRIDSAFSNQSGGTLLPQGGTLNIPLGFSNAGSVQMIAGGTLAGGVITNTGEIQGEGNIASPIVNRGRIEPVAGTLTLGGAVTNEAGGILSAPSGSQLRITSGLASNAGRIALNGGIFNKAGTMTNGSTGQIVGYGILRTGGLTNDGSIHLSGGSTTVEGDVINNAGKTIHVQYTPALFTGNVVNNGIFKNTAASITFAGSYTEAGTYVSDPADNFFMDVSIGNDGAWVGGYGDRFLIGGDLLSSSTNKTGWQTTAAELNFIAGADHILSVTGADLGPTFDGYIDNFAWGTLALAAGDDLQLIDGDGFAGGAIYVQKLLLGGGLSQISGIESNGLSLYYHLGDPANTYLDGQTYALPGGGSIAPVPEPAAMTTLLAVSILLRRRRLRRL